MIASQPSVPEVLQTMLAAGPTAPLVSTPAISTDSPPGAPSTTASIVDMATKAPVMSEDSDSDSEAFITPWTPNKCNNFHLSQCFTTNNNVTGHAVIAENYDILIDIVIISAILDCLRNTLLCFRSVHATNELSSTFGVLLSPSCRRRRPPSSLFLPYGIGDMSLMLPFIQRGIHLVLCRGCFAVLLLADD